MADEIDVQEIATAIIAALAPLGIHSYDYMSSSPIPPAAYIAVDELAFDSDFDGNAEARFIIRLLLSSQVEQSAQAVLNQYISTGPQSVKTLVEKDSTLGGVVASVKVTGIRRGSYGVVMLPEQAGRFYSAELVCEVLI